MSPVTQAILSALVLIMLGWCVYRERVIARLRGHVRAAYRDGRHYGLTAERKYWMNRRRIEMINADRTSEERPDSGPPARVSNITIHRRLD